MHIRQILPVALLFAGTFMACSLAIGERAGTPLAPPAATDTALPRIEQISTTPTLAALAEDVHVTGTVAANLAGEPHEWHTVLSPGIGGALINSATWSDELDADGSQEPGWQQTLYLEEGRFRIVRAIAKSALPGPRPPQTE